MLDSRNSSLIFFLNAAGDLFIDNYAKRGYNNTDFGLTAVFNTRRSFL